MRELLTRWLENLKTAPRSAYVIAGVVFAATALKVILGASQGVTVLAIQHYDDALYLRGAQFIRVGKWLGPFNNSTLAKGPFFPLWIGAVSRLSLPLPIANQLLYAFACGLVALVTLPFLRNAWASTGLYLVLLFNPLTTADGPATRVLRENVYPALTLLTIACAIGLLSRTGKSPKSSIPWAAGLAVMGAAFWLTREEGIWLAPLLLLPILGLALLGASREGGLRRTVSALLPWAVALVLGVAIVASVAGVNRIVYGVGVVTDTNAGSFPKAYGALLRITPKPWQPDAPVPTEVRQRAYAVSPTLASIAPKLEEWATNAPPQEKNAAGELKGGWLQWYVREVAAQYGVYADAQTSQRFFDKVASEINTACSDGRIECGPARTGLMPPIKTQYLGPFVSSAWKAALFLATYQDISPRPTDTSLQLSSREKPKLTRLVLANTIHAPLAGLDPPPPFHSQGQRILEALLAVYRWLTPPAVLASVVATLASLALAIKNRKDPQAIRWAGLLVTLAAMVFARIALVSLIDVTSFPAVSTVYLAPAYGIVILWAYLGVGFLATAPWRD